MEPTKELADELFRDKVRQARAMSPEERLLAGGRMFERGCQSITAIIRDRFPEATDEDVKRILSKVIDLYGRWGRL